jgi:tetratricopeptide (TPR) repeat protein
VRKTNHKPYIQQIDLHPGEPWVLKDFGLEDMILTMLRANVEREKQCVRHYMDLAHYLFVNDELDEAAEVYVKAQQVAVTPLEFAPETSAEEKSLEFRLRAEDADRLIQEIKRKKSWVGKDLTKFKEIVDRGQELAAGKTVTDWVFVRETVLGYIQDQKHQNAQALLLQHIAAVTKDKKAPQVNLPQAYIELILVRLRMHNLAATRETTQRFLELYGGDPACLRQAANGIYTTAKGYQGIERAEALAMAEQMLKLGTELSRPARGEPEMHALCKFELANVLCLQGRHEQAAPLYREAIAGTKDASTKELRTMNLVECLKTLNNPGEARGLLAPLCNSPREDIAKRAKEELRLLMPSPENK